MTARAHPSVPHHRTVGGRLDTRLPWWAVALPAIAFFALLMLLLSGGGAEAAQGGPQPLSRLLERVSQSLSL